jgi:penicillin-binding protein 2
VEKITDAEGNTIQTFHKEVLGTVHFPEIYWKTIEQGMAQVKIQGFDDAPYSVLRKTGTSQQDVKGGRVENAVFIAYAPADHPKLAVAVVVPEGGYGGWGASPIARKIFDAYDEAVGLYGKPRQTNANADPTGGAASGAAVQSGQAQAGQGSRP